MRPVIILFAKAPLPGRVKTRLIPPLSPSSAALLYTAFVSDIIERLQPLRRHIDIELHTDVPTDAWPTQALQHEGHLGLKMLQAMSLELALGRPQAMIVGSDAPTLPLGHLEHLLQSSAEVALGPAEDGGFYAIACRKVSDRMFDGVAWSSANTLEQTVSAALESGLTVELGAPWWDVDTPDDLARLMAAGDLPRHTSRTLAMIKADDN